MRGRRRRQEVQKGLEAGSAWVRCKSREETDVAKSSGDVATALEFKVREWWERSRGGRA